eukprot:353120-Chlamydomonas_euryale.AAC.7
MGLRNTRTGKSRSRQLPSDNRTRRSGLDGGTANITQCINTLNSAPLEACKPCMDGPTCGSDPNRPQRHHRERMAMSRRHAARLQPPSLRLMLLVVVSAAVMHTTVLCDGGSAGGSSSGVPKSPPDSASTPSPSAPSAPSAAAGNAVSTGGKEEPKSKASVRVPYKVHWAHMKTSDGRFIDARDMGVKHCALTVDGSAHGTSLGYSRPFTLHVFLRYTVHAGVAHIKGSVAVQLLTPLGDNELRDADVHFRPFVTMATSDNATRHAIAGSAAFPFVGVALAVQGRGLEAAPRHSRALACVYHSKREGAAARRDGA